MSGITTFANICPTDCNTPLVFPALATDQNCVPQLFQSEVTDLYFRPNTIVDGYPYGTGVVADWGTTTATPIVANPTAIDNAVTDNSKVKWITGIGDLPAAEKTVITVQKFGEATLRRTYTLTFTVQNLSNLMYDFLRALQCNPSAFTFWYANTSHFYGKDTGIIPTFVDADLPLVSGEDSLESGVITLKWKAAVDAERRNNPYS